MKNWTVTTQQVKKGIGGLSRHSNYLLSASHPSHTGTDIHTLNGSLAAIELSDDKRTEQRRQDGLRGGGVVNKATSFNLSLPREIRPTPDEWKKIMGHVVRNVAKVTGENPKDLARDSLIVLHDEKGGKCSHVHYLQSNIIGGKYNKAITQKRATMAVKYGFNAGVKKVMGIDVRNYKPEQENAKSKPLWKAREEKAEEAKNTIKQAKNAQKELDMTKADLRALKKFNTNFGNELKVWFESKDEKQALKSEQKLEKMNQKARARFSDNVLYQLGPYGAIDEAEKKKKRKTGITRGPQLKPPGM